MMNELYLMFLLKRLVENAYIDYDTSKSHFLNGNRFDQTNLVWTIQLLVLLSGSLGRVPSFLYLYL